MHDDSEESAGDGQLEEEAILEAVDLPDSVAGFSKRRVDLVQRAVKEWIHQLIDLGGRNNMLNYRDLRRGTLDLTLAEPTALSNLLKGKATKMSSLIRDDEDLEAALGRVRTIFKKASENFEERGVETLSLACGLATWDNPNAAWQPRAPILIRRASLHPVGAAQDDFDLTLLEEMEVSSVLLHVLRVEFACDFDQQALFERVEGSIDEMWEFDEAYAWIGRQAASVPGFSVEPRLVLANFAYTKLPMVRDLEGAFEELVAHDLIAAVAGDEEARQAIRSAAPAPESVPGPDAVPPQNEFLILDADASQSYAINAALAGANLIIRGPPGTGKSQTIANLIGSLAAQGKKVLFVAEKRAAIEAVLKRLRQHQLDDLVVDLHGGISSRREFAQAIGRALDAIRRTPAVDNDSDLRALERHRAALNDCTAALHGVREPWGVSAYQARFRLMGLQQFRTETRFRTDTLVGLDAETAQHTSESIAHYVNLEGPRWPSSPWAHSKAESPAEVQAAYDLVLKVQNRLLPNAQRLLGSAITETGLREPPSLNEWEPLLELLEGIQETLSSFTPAIFEENLNHICESLAAARRGGFSLLRASLFGGDYRRTRQMANQLRRDPAKVRDLKLLDLCERARDQHNAWRSHGATTLPVLPAHFDETLSAYDDLLDDLEAVEEWGGVADLCDSGFARVQQRLHDLLDDQGMLVNTPELKRVRRALRDAGLAEFLEEMEGDNRDWAKCFQFTWLNSILDHVSLSDRLLGGFSAEAQDRTVADFQAEDRGHITSTAGRIRRICAENAVHARDAFSEQDEVVRHQAGLRRRHLPVRDLIRSAGDVLLALKPCWAISPLVVSQLLPTKVAFDVVIFDEASQITPADATTSILRGRQLVVAGDERQLPPSAFFVTDGAGDDELEDNDIDVPIIAGTGGFESILDALRGLLGWRMLQWHYRSRDERLIAFSNAHIYDRTLATFPGALGCEAVLHHVVAPSGPLAETNSPTTEVEAALNLIFQHLRERPAESLGVITMGIKHANRIEEAFLHRLHDDPRLEAQLSDVLDPGREERFFIKNLERVQGDERDAIILSIGYGKNAQGKLPYRFGPLLQEGGERRLNVAVTRAKQRMTLVSSFTSGDMAVDKSNAEGVKLLRTYLQYMESLGHNLGDRAVDKPALNPFEVDVRDTLTRHGLDLIPQYGTSGYWIDFAVRHPDRPSDFVLAVECDGASYHSSDSARDRDRLRQEHLERLGWRFCRIWSTEWFRAKDSAVGKVLTAYQDALAGREGVPQKGGLDSAGIRVQLSARRPRNGEKPRIPYRWQSIQDYDLSALVSLVRWIESDGVLRTEDELLREVMTEIGFERRGKRVVSRLAQAIREARRSM